MSTTTASQGNPLSSLFLVVNPTSGGNRAGEFTSLGVSELHFKEEDIRSKLFIYDIREGRSGEKPAFQHILEVLTASPSFDSVSPLRVMVAGGDGTVMWTISELLAHGVEMERVAVGVVPFGTGNDFGRVTGWGGGAPSSIVGGHLKGLKGLVRLWLAAKPCNFDIWNVKFEADTEGGGGFFQVSKGVKSRLKDSQGEPLKVLSKPMCNYFSMGVESRIGVGFDRNRKNNQIRNKMVYMSEGMKKFLFKKTAKVPEFLDSIQTRPSQEGDWSSLCSTQFEEQGPKLVGNPVSLMVTNIPSISSGCDAWGTAKKNGVSPSPAEILSAPQDFGDGKLEVTSYPSLLKLSMEQAKTWPFSGNGARVSQSGGPLRFVFREQPAEQRNYFQVDGEFYQVLKPKEAHVGFAFKMKVLCRHQ